MLYFNALLSDGSAASLSAEAKVFVPGDPVTATLPEDNNKVFATPVSAKTTLQTPKRTPNSRQKKGSSRRDSQECAREDETIGVKSFSSIKKQKPPATKAPTRNADKGSAAVRLTGGIKMVRSNSENKRMLSLANDIVNGQTSMPDDSAAVRISNPVPVTEQDLFHEGLPLQNSAADELQMLLGDFITTSIPLQRSAASELALVIGTGLCF